MPDDDDYSDSEEPGLQFIARENLKTVNKGDKEPSDNSENDNDSETDQRARPEVASETWKDKHNSQPKTTKEESYLHAIPRMPYGGAISFTQTGRTVTLRNTCNIDNILQIFFTLFRTNDSIKEFLALLNEFQVTHSAQMLTIFRHMERGDWNLARKIAVVHIMEMTENELTKAGGNMYNSEEFFLKCISHFLTVVQSIDCPNSKCKVPKESVLFPMKDIIIRTPSELAEIMKVDATQTVCAGCNCNQTEIRYSWPDGTSPPMFCFPIAQVEGEYVTEDMVVSTYNLIDVKYEIFAYTVNYNDHYSAVFVLKNKKYIYDGTKSDNLHKHIPFGTGHKISTV
jgi:hypothetical protein